MGIVSDVTSTIKVNYFSLCFSSKVNNELELMVNRVADEIFKNSDENIRGLTLSSCCSRLTVNGLSFKEKGLLDKKIQKIIDKKVDYIVKINSLLAKLQVFAKRKETYSSLFLIDELGLKGTHNSLLKCFLYFSCIKQMINESVTAYDSMISSYEKDLAFAGQEDCFCKIVKEKKAKSNL